MPEQNDIPINTEVLRIDKEFLKWPGPVPFAHRGGASSFPENSRQAFENAWKEGYRYVETDVLVTGDSEPKVVAIHDIDLARLTGIKGMTIDQIKWEDLKSLRIKNTGEPILLEEILTTWPQLRVNIDPKSDATAEPLAKILQATKAVNRVCVASFSDERTKKVKAKVGPELCTAVGKAGILELVKARWGGKFNEALIKGFDCAQVPYKYLPGGLDRWGLVPVLDKSFLEIAHNLGLDVHAWIINSPKVMRQTLDMGVDGIMSDNIIALKKVLNERGQWFKDRPTAG